MAFEQKLDLVSPKKPQLWDETAQAGNRPTPGVTSYQQLKPVLSGMNRVADYFGVGTNSPGWNSAKQIKSMLAPAPAPAPVAPPPVVDSLGSRSMGASAENLLHPDAGYSMQPPVAGMRMISQPPAAPTLNRAADIAPPAPVSMVDANTALPRNTYGTEHGSFDISGSPRDMNTIKQMQAADMTSTPEQLAKRAESVALTQQRHDAANPVVVGGMQRPMQQQVQGPDYSGVIDQAVNTINSNRPTNSFDDALAWKHKVANAQDVLHSIGGMQTAANQNVAQQNIAGMNNQTDLYKADQSAGLENQRLNQANTLGNRGLDVQEGQNLVQATHYGQQGTRDDRKQQLAEEQANAMNAREAARLGLSKKEFELANAKFARENVQAGTKINMEATQRNAAADAAASAGADESVVSFIRAGGDPRFGMSQYKPQ